MTEWRPIPGMPLYEASDVGTIRRVVPTSRGHRPRVLRGYRQPSGYTIFTLIVERVETSCLLNRLVCMAFHGLPPTPKHEAAHGDGDLGNNRPDNLRWATKLENEADKDRHGTRPRGSSHYATVLCEQDIPAIDALYASGMRQRDIAAKYGVSQGSVYRAIHRITWSHVPTIMIKAAAA